VQLADDGDGVRRAPAGVLVHLGRVHEHKQEIVDSFRSNRERSLASAGVEVVAGRRGSWGREQSTPNAARRT
jgi:hypothetical protein